MAKDATGNWIAIDNFRLTRISSDIEAMRTVLQNYIDQATPVTAEKMNASVLADLQSAIRQATEQMQGTEEQIQTATDNLKAATTTARLSASAYAALKAVIDRAGNYYGTGGGNHADRLRTAIDQASQTYAADDRTNTQLADEQQTLEQAIWQYRLDNASRNEPLERTDLITNPDFEERDKGWTNVKMKAQSNTAFGQKQGSIYMEKWTGAANTVGNARLAQTIASLENGTYILTAAAQNINQNSSAAQTGAFIFADNARTEVNKANVYSVEFTVISHTVTIGFEAKEASGNWLSCDDFRLYYIDNRFATIQAELRRRIDEAKELGTQKMDETEKAALDKAIADAETLLADTDDTRYAAPVEALTAAVAAARLSAERIAFADKIANSTGTAPTVTTDTRYARGATMAFGRLSYKGVAASNILEQGFCFSTEKEPTVLDSRTSEYLENNGRIYMLQDLKPATIYYMRAYVITKDYAVGYGDVIKFATVPKGKVNWGYNYGGDSATNTRIENAIKTAYGHWEELTQIRDFYPYVTYSPGTPTADCGYGGSMRVGANSAYQSAGTIQHESGHGTGVGTHGRWWNTNLHNGAWYGDRANDVVRFWNNDNSAHMSGDKMHMWPYGVNGAQEDTHSDVLYMGNSLVMEGLWEDGLPATRSAGVAYPAYVFTQDDDTRYYIKNEDKDRGLYNSYLVENEKGQLVWKEMTAADAKTESNQAAWYVTFTPSNQYYQLRNATTGHYISYESNGANGVKAVAKNYTSGNEDWHLMRGRIDVTAGQGANSATQRGYWILHHTNDENPPALTAAAKGATSATTFDIANTATAQRWLILSEEENTQFETAAIENYRKEYTDYLAQLRKLVATPHVENVEGTDQAVNTKIEELETLNSTASTSTEVSALVSGVQTAAMDFLANATPADINNPFDITFLMQNPGIDDNSGWSLAPTFSYSCCEFFKTTFDFNQSIDGLPNGTYQLRAQAFQRPGTYAAAYDDYTAGKNNVSTWLYINSTTKKVKHIAADAQSKKLGGGEVSVGTPAVYIPNNMEAASYYFKKGLYDNEVTMAKKQTGALKLGLRCNTSSDGYWTIFDNFRLYYFGSMDKGEVTGIDGLPTETVETTPAVRQGIYNLQGQLLSRDASDVNTLPKGIYIVNGKKIIVR